MAATASDYVLPKCALSCCRMDYHLSMEQGKQRAAASMKVDPSSQPDGSIWLIYMHVEDR